MQYIRDLVLFIGLSGNFPSHLALLLCLKTNVASLVHLRHTDTPPSPPLLIFQLLWMIGTLSTSCMMLQESGCKLHFFVILHSTQLSFKTVIYTMVATPVNSKCRPINAQLFG